MLPLHHPRRVPSKVVGGAFAENEFAGRTSGRRKASGRRLITFAPAMGSLIKKRRKRMRKKKHKKLLKKTRWQRRQQGK